MRYAGSVATLVVLCACASAYPPAVPATWRPPPVPAGVTAAQANPIGKMAHVPEGTFRMGSETGDPDELPVHSVRVAAFDMDLTEVTVARYAECVRAGACVGAKREVAWPGVTAADQQLYSSECNGDLPERQDHAVNCVSWSMADAYCRWAGERLPTEEEWEYAACGGDCNDGTKGRTGRLAIGGASVHTLFTSRVAQSWPGPFGLYDMAGNLWEWTATSYCPYDHPGCSDPRRVIRGGSWSMGDSLFVRLTDRSPSDPSTRNSSLGFRCAR